MQAEGKGEWGTVKGVRLPITLLPCPPFSDARHDIAPPGLLLGLMGRENRKAPDSNYRSEAVLTFHRKTVRKSQYWTPLKPYSPSIRGWQVQPSLFYFQVGSV